MSKWILQIFLEWSDVMRHSLISNTMSKCTLTTRPQASPWISTPLWPVSLPGPDIPDKLSCERQLPLSAWAMRLFTLAHVKVPAVNFIRWHWPLVSFLLWWLHVNRPDRGRERGQERQADRQYPSPHPLTWNQLCVAHWTWCEGQSFYYTPC